MSDHELLADLPAPRDDEPPSLRADIVDELADHLRCAFRREVFKDGDETAARQRVLDRFGDPQKLARRLWWQAVRSLIMRQRILSGLQWLLTFTAVALAGAVFWQQSQIWQEMRAARQEEAVQRQDLTTALNQLRAVYGVQAVPTEEVGARIAHEKPADYASGDIERAPSLAPIHDETLSSPVLPPDTRPDGPRVADDIDALMEDALPPIEDESPPALSPPSLSVRIVQESADGPAVSPQTLSLMAHDGKSIESEEGFTDKSINDRFIYRSLQPGRYKLKVTLADGQNATRPVLIRDEKPLELTVICPRPRPMATVLVTMPPLTEDLRKAASDWKYWLAADSVLLDGVTWEPASRNSHTLGFDPGTGEATTLWEKTIATDLRGAKPEDRVVFMPEGPAAAGFSLILGGAGMDEYTLPRRTVEPGENRWTIELPEGFLIQARRTLRRFTAQVDPDGAPAPPADVEVSPPEGAPQFVLKLVQDKQDGPPASVDRVVIVSGKTTETAKERGSGDRGRFAFHTLAPGYHQLTVRLKDGQECTRPLLVRDEKPQELTLICPGPRKEVPISITFSPLPEELRKRNFEVKVSLVAGPVEVGQTKWRLANSSPQTVTFDGATGLPTAIEMTQGGRRRRFDLSELPADERSVFLPVGTVSYWFSATQALEGHGSVPVYEWPANMKDVTVRLKQAIAADQKSWKLEVPPEFVEILNRAPTDMPTAVQ